MQMQILPQLPTYLLLIPPRHISWRPQILPILPLHLHISWQPMQISPQHPHIPWQVSLATIAVKVTPSEVRQWPVEVFWLAIPVGEVEEEVEASVATKEEEEVEALVPTKVAEEVEV